MTSDEIQHWLRAELAKRLRIAPEAVDVKRPFEEYGIDSLEAVVLTSELETMLGRRVDPTALWDHRTIADLAAFLAGERQTPAASATAGLSDADVDRLLRKMNGQK